MNSEALSPVLKRKGLKRKRLLLNSIFYILMAGIPILQVLVFYVGVNINSIFLAFKSYNVDTMTYSWLSADKLFSNFSEFLGDLNTLPYLKASFKNSFMIFGLILLVSFSGGILLCNYIYKKRLFGKIFIVILFTPSMVSSLVLVTLFKYFADQAVPALLNGATVGLLADTDTTFITIICYVLWLGFGSGILVYTGTMNSISDSLVEAAQLDGCTPVKEFFYITLPTIYPTIIVFLVAKMSQFFAEQIQMYTFFGADAPYDYYTYGYWMYVEIQSGSQALYPYLAAAGLVFTAILAPLVLFVRWLLMKVGPSAD